jgi:transposase
MARQRRMGAHRQDPARAEPSGTRAKRHTHRSDPRFAVGQDGAKRGRRSYDARKKIKGRKRHIAVDTEGNLLAVIVHSAGIQGPGGGSRRADAALLLCRFDTITTVFADGGYTGKLIDWAKEMFRYTVEVVKRNEQHLFRVLPKRWIVERTFAWLAWSRRLSKDYELRHGSAETMIHIAFAHQLLRRIA